MANTESYVSTGKPKVGGAVYVGATTAALPTDTTTTLPGFTCLGYCSEDGLTNSTESSSEEVKAWGGDTVLIFEDDKSDSFQLTFIEALNPDVLKEIYGANKVSGALATGISVAASAGLGHRYDPEKQRAEAHRHPEGHDHGSRGHRL